MASPASFGKGKPIVGPVNPGQLDMKVPSVPDRPSKKKPGMKIQPIAPKPKPKLSKMAQKYRGIKQTKEVNPVYNTY
jgi:hypothetical protein